MTPTDLKEYVKKHNIKMIDAKFVDFLGQWKHLTYPIERLEEGIEGLLPRSEMNSRGIRHHTIEVEGCGIELRRHNTGFVRGHWAHGVFTSRSGIREDNASGLLSVPRRYR